MEPKNTAHLSADPLVLVAGLRSERPASGPVAGLSLHRTQATGPVPRRHHTRSAGLPLTFLAVFLAEPRGASRRCCPVDSRACWRSRVREKLHQALAPRCAFNTIKLMLRNRLLALGSSSLHVGLRIAFPVACASQLVAANM
jgi:hypothetical protein